MGGQAGEEEEEGHEIFVVFPDENQDIGLIPLKPRSGRGGRYNYTTNYELNPRTCLASHCGHPDPGGSSAAPSSPATPTPSTATPGSTTTSNLRKAGW